MADYVSRWFLSRRQDWGDTALDHYAWNVERRGASWRMAGRRGENYKLPGSDGSIFNKSKPFDENFFVLDMWAQGCAPDGTIPSDAALKCRNNLDELSRLFGFKGLRELIRADTPGYGRLNMIPNPSAENAGQKITLRENVVNNPSAEGSDGQTIIRRNFASNPGMERSSANRAYRTNLVPNPRMAGEAEPTITLRNFVKNPSLEAGTKFWREQLNVKMMTSRKVRVGGTWPVQGQQSLRCVALAAGNTSVEAHSIDIDPTKNWTFSGSVWQRTEQVMTVRMFVRWFNGNGAFISATSNVDFSLPVEGTTRLSQTILSASIPSAARSAAIRFVLVSALQDDVMYVDGVMANPTSALKNYFDGDSDEEDGFRYRWKEQAGRSVGYQYTVPVKGWMSPVATQMATTDHSKAGVQGIKVLVGTATTANQVVLRQTVSGGCKIDEDEWAIGSISAKRASALNDDSAPTRTIKITLHCYDSDGNFLSVAKDSGGVDIADVTQELRPGHWFDAVTLKGKTVTDTARVLMVIKCGEAWSSDEIVYFDTAIVENAQNLGEYFDGNIDDDDTFDYVWSGEAHNSQSEQRGSVIIDWTADQGKQFQSANGYIRQYAMQLEPYRSPTSTDRPMASSYALDLRPGRKHRLSAYVNLSRSHSVQLGVSYDDGVTWSYGGAATPTANTWTRLSFGFTPASTADPSITKIAIASNAAPADGDSITIDAVLFEPCEALRKYFDGDSTIRTDWLDDPDMSISAMYRDAANGWFGYGTSFPIARRVKSTNATQGNYIARVVAAEAGDLGVTFAQDGIDADLDYSFGIDFRPSVTRNGYVAVVWYDEGGTQVGISQSTTTSIASGANTRKTITGSPPAGASVAVPIAILVGAAADETADFDGAVFGFGASTDFKDGTSGSGWEWTGKKFFSESRQIGVGVDYWRSNNGTLARDNSWSSDRTYNGTFTVTNSAANCWVQWFTEQDDDDRRFKLTPTARDSELTFSVDCRAVSVNQQFQVRFMFYRWTKLGWRQTTVNVDQIGPKVTVNSGVTQRISMTIDTAAISLSDATHFMPAVWVYNGSGANAALGQVSRFDSACLSRDDVSVYIAGDQQWVVWMGDKDASTSKRIGPARRILVERLAAIEPESSDAGRLAVFSVQLLAPSVFWEDTIVMTQKLALPRNGGILEFDTFQGTTAPINDAIITLNGPFKDIKITDVGSGEWIRINERFKDDQNVVIDNEEWEVRRGNGKMLFTVMSHSGTAILLPVTVAFDRDTPRLKVEADSIGRGAYITLKARRKYHIA